jgi:tetraacyldisaccharide 4'-kinase
MEGALRAWAATWLSRAGTPGVSRRWLAALYDAGARLHRWSYCGAPPAPGGAPWRRLLPARALLARQRLPAARAVSVGGNCALGGSGKTPMVEFLAHAALARGGEGGEGAAVLVLTRGYRGGDEARQLARNVPSAALGVGGDRARAAAHALAARGLRTARWALLDDALQHPRVLRDVDVLMVNALQGVDDAFARTLPAGALREPWARALGRASVVVLHHADLAGAVRVAAVEARLRALAPAALPFFHSRMVPRGWMRVVAAEQGEGEGEGEGEGDAPAHGLVEALPQSGAAAAVAFCGVGFPEGFRRAVAASLPGARVELRAFPDHHPFSRAELAELRRIAQRDDALVVTTEKDWARSGPLMREELGSRCWVLRSQLALSHGEQDAFLRLVLGADLPGTGTGTGTSTGTGSAVASK